MKRIQRLIIDRYVTCRHGTTNIPKISYDGIIGTNQRGPRSLEFLPKVLNVDLSIIYLSRKVFCFVLLCSYEVHQIGMFQIVFLVSLESSQQGGVHGLNSMKFGLVVQNFLNIE